MENENILYFDGISARPSMVRVLVFNDHLHLHKDDDDGFNESFPVSATIQNRIGDILYIYTDNSGLKYLQVHADHPVAKMLESEIEKNGNWYHKALKQRTFVLLSIMVALAIGLYFIVINLVPFIGMRVISVQQEISLGDGLKDAVLNESTVFGDEVDTTGSWLLKQFADKIKLSEKYPIKVTLVNSGQVNAFALPGGNIVVYKGILQKMKSADELAALLAHESTHINERHTLRSLLRNAANGMIISIIFGDASGFSGAIISSAESLNGLHYSRSLETEADWKGMQLMESNGINVTGMQQLMKRLQEEEKLPGDFSFFSTHPLTKERIAAAKLYAAKHRQSVEARKDLQVIFERLKEGVEE